MREKMETSGDKSNNSFNRNSSIELLRILSMFMIVLCHFATHGNFHYDVQMISIPRLWWNFIEMGGNLGVDVFVLITGYFLINHRNKILNTRQVLKFWGQVFFYSITISAIFMISGIRKPDAVSLLRTFFPVTFESWWFARAYFVLYIIHPFINMLLHKLDKNLYQKLIIILAVLWVVIPTLTTSSYQSNSLIWFVTLYCIAGYIRLYGLNSKFTSKHYCIFFAVFSLLRYLSCVVLMLIGTQITLVARGALVFYEQQSVLTVISAISLFMGFEKMHIKQSKWINVIASAAFGVYLIHENFIMRPFLWLTVCKNNQKQGSLMLIPYSVTVAILIYVSCTIIDLLRQRLIEKSYMKLVDKYTKNINTSLRKTGRRFCNLLFGVD